MKKVVKLTEGDLNRIVKKVIKEQYDETQNQLWNDIKRPIDAYLYDEGRPSIMDDDSKVIEVIDVLEQHIKELKQRLKPSKKWFK